MWFISVLIVVIFIYLILDTQKPSRYPPGPKWIPLIGNYMEYRKLYRKLGFTHLVWSKLSNEYGQLMGLRLGKDLLVIASGFEAVKEVLTREEFNARPDGFFFRLRAFGERYGLVFVDGEFFKEQKQFCMRHLKLLGLYNSSMEDRISFETNELVNNIKKHKGIIAIPEALQVSVINSLWAIVAGERFKTDDSRPKELMKHINLSFKLQDMSGGILNQMPIIRYIAPELSSFNKLKFVLNSLISFITELVEEHLKTASPYNNRDLIDAYINEMNKNSKDSTFSEKQLIILLLDLFLAGAETTTSTLGYALLYLIRFQEIQKKLQDEMERVIGRGKQPTLQDRARLKYMGAFLMELQRHANITPTTVSHRAKSDVEILGFDTTVLANLYSLHADKHHWGDPENFRPERFINSNGELIHDDWFLPFGLGKRKCMGENLAKASLFLFVTALLNEFTVTAVTNDKLPTLRAVDGATISPTPFECCFIPR
uniref:Uncharacterized protein n=1 Tax=Rhodnius prolixus TaxID=13249 RepID=T1H914_RHOPR